MTPGPEASRLAPLLAALHALFPQGPPPRLGVAVSGGGDSLALLHLAAQAFPARVHAVTVDHALRPESADEAAGVAAFCAARDLPHQTLVWQGPAPRGNLMDQARRARLSLIGDWAAGQGIADVLLGHTADDQAETVLMTLGRAAGVDGLCGLRPRFVAHGLTFHRPLLAIPRAALRAHLTALGVGWIDDPSNDNPRFTRARARKALAALAPLGITAATLATSARNLASARAALQESLAALLGDAVETPFGTLRITAEALARLPDELQRRLVISALRWMGGQDHPPAEPQLRRLREALARRNPATLGGVKFTWKGNSLTLTREARAQEGPVAQGARWDHRWHFDGPPVPGAEIRALGPDGLLNCPDWRGFGPRAALVVTPALWQGTQLIAAPFARAGDAHRAILSQPFADFILSH